MFVVEIPTISEKVNCDTLNLMLGGVKSYNIDNIYAKRTQCEQNFKLFIGFQNKICCNLCVWSDGFKEEISIKSISQLYYAAQNLFSSFNAKNYLDPIKDMGNIEVTETDFAKIIGRSRMYKYMPEKYKKEIPPLLFGDQQMGAVVNSYYNDENFGLPYGGSMALYKLYNLLTGANKSSYIDAFLERGINAFDFSMGVLDHKQNRKQFWYLG
ncbi:MAG: hypothetical protein A2491_00255 [Bacteroidetes bacterium RIFOXYC12_FULL_35_7]|nr:MAG: hypothetical protein A2491_00255 [Bacteroidetes bacterium RIFOXYC12_FULL_35_7]